jgi:site-specific recombinase XerD
MSEAPLVGTTAGTRARPVQSVVTEVPALAPTQEPQFGASEGTYRPGWQDFSRWCHENGKDPRARSQGVIREAIEGYVTSKRFRALSSSTQATYLSAIMAAHENLGQPLDRNDTFEIRKVLPKPESRRLIGQISDEQVIQLVRAMRVTRTGIRDKAIILLIRAANLRRAEVANLNAEDVTVVGDEMAIRFRRSRGQDYGEVRITQRNDELCPVTALKAWLDASQITSGPLFPSPKGGHLIVNQVRNIIRTAGERIGLAALTPEALRRTEGVVRYIHVDPTHEAAPEESAASVDALDTVTGPRAPAYSADDFSSETAIPVETIRLWEGRLNRKKHVIFQGPPGTGKTFVAERLAGLLTSESLGFVETLQFHPSYSYEDFMQGIRPVTRGGQLTFEPARGRFMQFCDKAAEVTDGSPCVLIIDEINRGNLSRIFGELMYLLEYREKAIPLAGESRPFHIPENVFLIGTMNTADRSIALVDHALRRRFSFIHLGPDYAVLQTQLERNGLPAEPLVETLRAMNAVIDDRNYEVGISFFLKDGESLRQTLHDIWEGEIEPYLEEFFYDQPGKLDPFRWKTLITGRLATWTTEP